MTQTELSEDDIRALLAVFYEKVRADRELGPVFAAAIADGEWPAHMEHIQDFWSSILLKSGRYKNNPFLVHKGVAGMAPELFERWLALFKEACEARLPLAATEMVHGRAVQIAASLKAGLFFHPGGAAS